MNKTIESLLANPVPLYRRDLHAAVGGQTQSGISPSAREPVVLLFSDRVSGPLHGYIDEWGEDGFYHYTGEGQLGDQVMARGNKAIRDHSANDRELHLFEGTGKGQPISYRGQFNYVDHYDADAPETGGGQIRRRVFRFRLRPLGQTEHAKTGEVKKADSNLVHEVAVEASNTEKAVIDPTGESYEVEKKEAKLVADFVLWNRRDGREFKRLKIVPKGEAIPIFSDLYCKADKQLVEAKGSVSRDAIRMAIGQIYDYRRFTEVTSLAILLPELPRPDLIELIRTAGITIIYRSDSGFETTT